MPMEEKQINSHKERLPDGGFDVKHGQTTYKVKIFFDHRGTITAEDKLKRVIQQEALKIQGKNIHVSP